MACGLNEMKADNGFNFDRVYCISYSGPRYNSNDPIVVSRWKFRNTRKCICRLGYARLDVGICVKPNDPQCTELFGPTV